MGLLSLGDLVKELKEKEQRVYIPLYQRNYRWSDSKTDKCGSGRLMKDILEKCNKGEDHFLGMITVYNPNERECQILDGQQRFITLSLIMKAIGMADDEKWVKLEFERDPGFTGGEERSPRYDFIYGNLVGAKDDESIDVSRMKRNFYSITEVIGKKTTNEKEQIYKNVLKHLKIFLHFTSRKPIDEFLNMNFNKTPFCAADYIKAYMIMESSSKENTNFISIKKIMELWKKIEYVLYQLGDSIQENRASLENDMYELIKKNYTEEKKNRMEVLFEHRYYGLDDKGKKVVNCDSYHKEDALQQEYEVLVRYYNIMKNLLEELSVTDRDGRRYPNYTAYSAYNLLCSKKKKVRFFELFENEEDVHNVLYEQFNLTDKSYKELKIGDRENVNQFMEAMLITENTTNSNQRINTILSVPMKGGAEKFDEYKNLFDDIFNEFVDIIDAGKMSEELSIGRGDKPFTMEELFKDEKIRQIKIPQIQRDYVMGGSGYYLYCYLCRIRYEELKFRFDVLKKRYDMHQTIPFDNTIGGKTIAPTRGKIYELVQQEVLSKKEADLPSVDKAARGNVYFKQMVPSHIENNITGREVRYNSSRKYVEALVGNIDSYATPLDYRSSKNGVLADWLNVRNEFIDKHINEILKEMKDLENFTFASIEDYRMNTSCIMGYLDEQGTFWVYDGQQRLTTSVVLLAYLSKKNNTDAAYRKYLNKFSFEGRDGANQILKSIILSPDWPDKDSMKYSIDDNTSYAIYQFWNLLKAEVENEDDWKEFRSIHPDYIWKGMDFELVLMDEASDAEQMFMEMNEGLKLEGEEKYKAQLCHVMNTLNYSSKECFLRKMDNEWLNVWKDEKKEVEWIKYCITMSYFEKQGYDAERVFSDLQNLSEEVLRLAESAIGLFAHYAKKNCIEASNSVNYEAIWRWSATQYHMFSEITYGLLAPSERSIFFTIDDFRNLIAQYYCFNVQNKEELCFKHMQDIRNGRGVVIREREEGGDNAGNGNEKAGNMFLENRWNRYEYLNIKKWEEDKNCTKIYQKEWKEQCYDLKDIRVELARCVSVPFIPVSCFGEKMDLFEKFPHDWNVNDLFTHLSSEDIVNNLRYWYYDANPEDKLQVSVSKEIIDRIIDCDERLCEIRDRLIDEKKWEPTGVNNITENTLHRREDITSSQNELVIDLVKIAEKCLNEKRIGREEIFKLEGGFTKWIEWIKSGGLDKTHYRNAIIALAEEKGLLYWPVEKDKSRFMELVALCPNYCKSPADIPLCDMLKLYKNCDKSLKEIVANYIVEYYKANCIEREECNQKLFDFVIWHHKKNNLSYKEFLYAKTKEFSGVFYKQEQLDNWIKLFMGEGDESTIKALGIER